MYSMSWQLVAVFLQIHFSISNTILFENIQDHSKKIGLFLKVSMSSITWPKPKNDISTISRFRKILGIQSKYVSLTKSHSLICDPPYSLRYLLLWDHENSLKISEFQVAIFFPYI